MTQSDNFSINTPSSTLNPVNSDWLDKYYRESLENLRRRLPEAARVLREAGVARVRVDYDGSGDSGQIEQIGYLGADGAELNLSGTLSFPENELMDLFYDLIQVRHPGWENNDGAYGDFEWDLTKDTLYHTHNDRFTDYDTTEHEGL
jgi:hypothetical protein